MLLTLNWNLKSYPKWLAWPSLARSRRWASTFQGNCRAVNKYFGLRTVLMLLVRCVRSPRRAQSVSDWNKGPPYSLLSAGENGVAAAQVRRGGSPESTAVSTASEASSKRPETPSKGSNGEEPPPAPTPGRSSGKGKQTIDVKAELEKRQGGKPLLNLVVIGRKEVHKPLQKPLKS